MTIVISYYIRRCIMTTHIYMIHESVLSYYTKQCIIITNISWLNIKLI